MSTSLLVTFVTTVTNLTEKKVTICAVRNHRIIFITVITFHFFTVVFAVVYEVIHQAIDKEITLEFLYSSRRDFCFLPALRTSDLGLYYQLLNTSLTVRVVARQIFRVVIQLTADWTTQMFSCFLDMT